MRRQEREGRAHAERSQGLRLNSALAERRAEELTSRLEKRTQDGVRGALRYFEEANSVDSEYAPALAWKALACVLPPVLGLAQETE